MAMGGGGSSVRIWDISKNLAQPILQQEIVSHSDSVSQIRSTDVSVCLLTDAQNQQIVSVSMDYTVNVFDPRIGTRFYSFDTGAAMFCVATVVLMIVLDQQTEDLIFAAGKDYTIHVYSMNRQRYYQAMEEQYMVQYQRPPRIQYNV